MDVSGLAKLFKMMIVFMLIVSALLISGITIIIWWLV